MVSGDPAYRGDEERGSGSEGIVSLNVRVRAAGPTPVPANPPPPPQPPGRTRVILVPLIAMALVVTAIGVVALLDRARRPEATLTQAATVRIPAGPSPRSIWLPLPTPVRGLAVEATLGSAPATGFAGVACRTDGGVGYVLALRADGATGIARIDAAGVLTPLTPLRPAEAFRPDEAQRLRLECVPATGRDLGVLATGSVNGVPAVTLAVPDGIATFVAAGVSAWLAPAGTMVKLDDVVATRHRADSGPPPMIESPAEPPPRWEAAS